MTKWLFPGYITYFSGKLFNRKYIWQGAKFVINYLLTVLLLTGIHALSDLYSLNT